MAWDDAPPDAGASAGWDSAPPDVSKTEKVLGGVGKALDYQRGAVGAPILASIAGALSGKHPEDLLSRQEALDAANPTTSRRAPNSDTILARAGVPSGPSLSQMAPPLFQKPGSTAQRSWYDPRRYAPEKGGMLDMTPRGVAGTALDIATDPLTYESGGVNKAVEAAKAAGEGMSPTLKALSAALTPASNTTEAVGKGMYKSGMYPLVAKGAEYGKDVADDLYNAGMFGGRERVARIGDAAADSIKGDVQANRSAAQNVVDSSVDATMGPQKERAMQPFIDDLNSKVANGNMSRAEADRLLEKELATTEAVAQPTFDQLGSWKTRSYKTSKAPAFLESANPDVAKGAEIAKSGGYRSEMQNTLNDAIPGAGDKEEALNKSLGNLLTVQGVADKQATKAGATPLVIPSPNAVQHQLTTALTSGNPLLAPLHYAGSTLAKALSDRSVRNTLGYMARGAGTNGVTAPLIDAATANTLRNMANKNQPQPVAGVGK